MRTPPSLPPSLPPSPQLYMLYDITPDESVTGGAWYSDQDFESEFVQILNQQCLKFLEQKVSREWSGL